MSFQGDVNKHRIERFYNEPDPLKKIGIALEHFFPVAYINYYVAPTSFPAEPNFGELDDGSNRDSKVFSKAGLDATVDPFFPGVYRFMVNGTATIETDAADLTDTDFEICVVDTDTGVERRIAEVDFIVDPSSTSSIATCNKIEHVRLDAKPNGTYIVRIKDTSDTGNITLLDTRMTFVCQKTPESLPTQTPVSYGGLLK